MNQMLVVEQRGLVWAFSQVIPGTQHLVLDHSSSVFWPESQTESGFLSVAPHPEFGENGFLFAFYIADVSGQPATRISRFETTGSLPTADASTELIILEIQRQDWAHNGGDLHFGADGYLYASLGDAMCCADPLGSGQDLTTLFGSVIRIDVDGASEASPYSIPPDNPFVGVPEARDEIWAYGFRNPWRFSIDHESGELWLGDVGEIMFEEINLVVPGGNYGWNITEGEGCFEWPPNSGNNQDCDLTDLIPPAIALDRDDAVSITGGYVYRGSRRPDLEGSYIFADWGTTGIWAAERENGELSSLTLLSRDGWPLISSFGVDESGELYAVDHFGGRIFAFQAGLSTEPTPGSSLGTIRLSGANPVREHLNLEISGKAGSVARVVVSDLLGRTLLTPHDEQIGQSEVIPLQIDTSSLAAGVYLAWLQVDGMAVGGLRFTVVR